MAIVGMVAALLIVAIPVAMFLSLGEFKFDGGMLKPLALVLLLAVAVFIAGIRVLSRKQAP
jgi:hypothetical protein